jgi:hypothetical protein
MRQSITARELLIKHRREVRRLAARLIECRRMAADNFERFMSQIRADAGFTPLIHQGDRPI